MRSFLPLALCCVSLLSLPLRAEPRRAERPGNRWDLLHRLIGQRQNVLYLPGSQTDGPAPPPASSPSSEWPPAVQRRRPASPGLAWARPDEASPMERRPARARRHAMAGLRGGHHYPHHGQLMRVGCVLGTCQVQNLSHRLYQLIGQNGREDSSPINPKSPHSYG